MSSKFKLCSLPFPIHTTFLLLPKPFFHSSPTLTLLKTMMMSIWSNKNHQKRCDKHQGQRKPLLKTHIGASHVCVACDWRLQLFFPLMFSLSMLVPLRALQ